MLRMKTIHSTADPRVCSNWPALGSVARAHPKPDRPMRCKRVLLLIASFAAAAAGAPRAATDIEQLFERLRSDSARLERFLREMPKGGELHLHLTGSISPDVVIEWALQHGFYVRHDQRALGQIGLTNDVDVKLISPATYQRLPTAEGRARFVPLGEFLRGDGEAARRDRLRERFTIQYGERWDEFPNVFLRFGELMAYEPVQPDLVRWVVRRAHDERLNYLELRVNPFIIVSAGGAPVEPRAAVAALAAAAADENRQWPVEERVAVRYVVALGRHAPDTPDKLAAAFALVEEDDGDDDVLVGVDLVGPEELGPPIKFFPLLIDLARRHPRVRMTLHAGESDRSNLHVRDSILLGARRIGHGTNLFRDPTLSRDVLDTVSLVRSRRVLIEVALTSNDLLVLPPRTLHPFIRYLREGLLVSLNTDDAGIFQTDLTREFTKAVTRGGLSWAQVRQLARNSLEYAFAAERDRQELLRRWEKRIERFERHPPPATASAR